MITNIAHNAYNVADMKKTLAFYCDQLGLRHAFSLANDKGEPWIEYVLVTKDQFIEFFYTQPGFVNRREGSYAHLCLQVSDIHEIARRMEEQGIDVYAKPSQGLDHNWQCWANDPDGNPIEFMQIMPDSLQAEAMRRLGV